MKRKYLLWVLVMFMPELSGCLFGHFALKSDVDIQAEPSAPADEAQVKPAAE